MTTAAEIEQRNRYWFDHYADFACTVVVSTPERRNARVGAYGHGLFASMPIPFRAQDIDRGEFKISDGCVWVYAQYKTYCWPLRSTRCLFFQDGSGAEMRLPNKPVITLRGPVAAPLAGAYAALGLLEMPA